MSEKVIFNCDKTLGLPFKEIDDGLTLLYLLGKPEIKLLGITTTFGNGRLTRLTSKQRNGSTILAYRYPSFAAEDLPKAHQIHL